MNKNILAFSLFICSFSFFTLTAQTGFITTIGGYGPAGYNGDNIAATSAKLNADQGVAVDKAGNVYIADLTNHRIRKIATTGIITTIGGTGTAGYSGDGGQATSAKIRNPTGVRVDTLGNVYFSDGGNAIIRKIAASGIITTIAGIPGIGGYTGNGGQATSAELSYPVGLALDKNLNVYIADQVNNAIRKITVGTGVITTVAGTGVAGFSGNGGAATSAQLNGPTGVAVDKTGNIYIADNINNEIRMVNTSGIISDFAGTGVAGYNGSSGIANTIEIYNPLGVSTDASGNVYLTDPGDGYIREVIASSNMMFVIAGNANSGYNGDNIPAVGAELDYPFDVVVDANQNVYIADQNNNRIRKITATCSADTSTGAVYNYPGCHNSSDGIIQAQTNSPFSPYTYLWSNGKTTQQVTGLSRGTYTITITDAVGCTASGTVTLTVPPALRAISQNDSVCPGGQLTLTSSASGGVAPYTYIWDNGHRYDTLTVAPTGNTSYTIFVTDFNGCSDSTVVNVTIDNVPSLSIIAASYNECSNSTTDLLTGAPSGGTYSGPGVTGNNFDANAVGVGTFDVTYSYTTHTGCTTSITTSITVEDVSITMASHTNINCNGNSTGSATANAATGGTSPYHYSWSSGGGTNLTASNLSAGTYTITATDNNGCMGTAMVTITQPANGMSITIASSANVNCNGNSTGSATANAATGGTSPYHYSWSPGGGTNLSASNLSAGTYTITATDNNGCTGTASVTITQPANGVSITIASSTNINCNGNSTGSAIANAATGGTSPYHYAWSPSGGTNLTASNLSAGTYTITATDNNGCTASSSIIITQPTALSLITDSMNANSGCNGSAWIITSGGTQPYSYIWSPGGQTTDSIFNQCGGSYCCIITDNNGCIDTACVTVNMTTGVVNNPTPTSGIVVYPNPSTGVFQFSILNSQFSINNVEVYNVLGEKVFSQFSINNFQLSIDLSSKANGVYIYKVFDEDGKIVSEGKLVIQK